MMHNKRHANELSALPALQFRYDFQPQMRAFAENHSEDSLKRL